ncbi:MAG: GNAT family N-acetyltransferase [Ignisphaera sp.]
MSYEVDLERFYYPRRVLKIENDLTSQGFLIRKAREDEAEKVGKWVGEKFSPIWRLEALYAFRCKPPSIWLAEQNNELAGFAVYRRMGRNEFGPVGVDPNKRRLGIGTVLLFKSLYELKQLGFRFVVIPWTSHLFYYTQVPGIAKIKHYYIMAKSI